MKGHIRKRAEGSWTIVIYLGRDPATGKKKYRWHTVNGTKREAEKVMARLLNELNTGQYVEPGKESVGAYLDRWLEGRQVDLAYKTVQGYRTNIERHIKPRIGQVRLDKLRPAQIQALYTELRQTGLAARTVSYVHRTLHVALEQAVKWQILHRNPVDLVEPPKLSRPEVSVLDGAAVGTILEAIKEPRLAITVTLAVGAGMRRGEILGLRWTDIDLQTRVAYIVQSSQRHIGEGVQFTKTKTHRSRRAVALPGFVIGALEHWRAHQEEERRLMGSVYHDLGLVCTRHDGQPLDPDWVSKSFGRVARKAGFSGIRFHDLRHTHATLLLAAGVHPKVVQERLGHSQISMTLDTYSHVLPGLQHEAAASLEDIIKGRKSISTRED